MMLRTAQAATSLQLAPEADARFHAGLTEPPHSEQYYRSDSDRPTLVREITADGIALLQISGPIYARRSYYYANYPLLVSDLQWLSGNQSVRAVLLWLSSAPGGEVAGCFEACQAIAGCEKPVYAFMESMAASAAVRLACYAERIFSQQSAQVGHIGTRISLNDWSENYRRDGVRHIDVISRGAWMKTINVPGAEITDQQIEALQRGVDRDQQGFAEALRIRGLTAQQIATVSTGETWDGGQALQLGLVDEIASSVEVVLGRINQMLPSVRSGGQSTMTRTVQQAGDAGSVAPSPLGSLSAVQQAAPQQQAAAAPAENPAATTSTAPAAQQQAAAQPPAQQTAPQTPAQPQQSAPASPAAVQQAQPAQPQQQTAPQQAPASPIGQAQPQQAASNQLRPVQSYAEIQEATFGQVPSDAFVAQCFREGWNAGEVSRNFVQQLAGHQASQSAPAGVRAGQFSLAGSDTARSTLGSGGASAVQQLEEEIQRVMSEQKLPRIDAARQVLGDSPQAFQQYAHAARGLQSHEAAARRHRLNPGRVATSMYPAK